MAQRKWTKEQQEAISARGGTILVSAAAGSGKTAVLVERVISRITQEENPCDVDRLLIVTFTKAAAAEMRERIDAALTAKRRQRPWDARLLRQQMLLPHASICTIDSFCNDLVRRYFHQMDLPPDYKIVDSAELCLLQERAVELALEEMYTENSGDFLRLVELMSAGRDDTALAQSVQNLYTYIMAYPFPQDWLAQMAAMFSPALPLEETLWGEVLFHYAASALSSCCDSLRLALDSLAQEQTLYNAYGESLLDGIRQIEQAIAAAQDKEWDALVGAISRFSFLRWKAVRGYQEDPLKASVTAQRDEIKKQMAKLKEIYCISREEHREDMRCLAPVVQALCRCVACYGAQLDELKRQRKAVDFADIEHLALRILVTKAGDGVLRTQTAQELAQQYEEVLVDEYQDTNETQDLLFRAVSREESNLFFVGDVKQSIYRFRQAMPEIFLRRRDRLPAFDGTNYPARILLGKNFRSRRGVTQAVNFIFRQLMSPEIGELDYNDEEALVYAAEYAVHAQPDFEMHVLDSGDKAEGEEKDAFEARYLAAYLHQLLNSGLTVKQGEGTRPVAYRDICILLRSANAHAKNYVRELQAHQIPAWAELSGSFFGAQEISVMLSFLRIIDNPMQDVPFLTVMLSPVYGFTPDDLAQLRVKHRKTAIYLAALREAGSGDSKYVCLLKDLEYLRCLSAALPADALIRKIYDGTGYPCMVLAMKNAAQRQANLHLLLEYARQYESAGFKGLSNFIRYIDNVERRDQDLSPASALSENADVVRVMSIHRSKGLEFPICILAGCGSQFNASSRKGNLLLHPSYGIGVKRLDEENMRKFPTASYEAVKLETERAELSEELRVFYVAATRAKERLVTVMTLPAPERRLAALAAGLGSGEKLPPFSVRRARGYSDWLLMCALRHPDGRELRRMAGIGEEICLPADFSMKVHWGRQEKALPAEPAACASLPAAPAQPMHDLKQRLDYVYPYGQLRSVLAKRAASELGEDRLDWEFFAHSRPAFLGKHGLTPAQRGTALHKFMQFCSYAKAQEDPAAERDRLVEGHWLTTEEGEAIPLEKIARFFASPLAGRLLTADKVYREYKFAIELPAGEVDPSLSGLCAQEPVLVQGIADCIWIEQGKAVILDFKTDRIHDPQTLVQRYQTQMEVYRRAVEECLSLPVQSCLLYAFAFDEWVEAVPHT